MQLPINTYMGVYLCSYPNYLSTAFHSVDDYLDIQFRLLREDFVSTIRKGIKDFKDNPHLTGANRFRSGEVKVYENFTVLTPNFGKSGITYLIK